VRKAPSLFVLHANAPAQIGETIYTTRPGCSHFYLLFPLTCEGMNTEYSLCILVASASCSSSAVESASREFGPHGHFCPRKLPSAVCAVQNNNAHCCNLCRNSDNGSRFNAVSVIGSLWAGLRNFQWQNMVERIE
jgi:hypothetical protein